MINLRDRVVEGDGIDYVLMAFKTKKLCSIVNVPNFTGSVIAARQAPIN
jgi:hypothetical protein